jgi:hypothetical protein
VIAEVVAKTDKTVARKLILEAYDILAESVARPRRAWWCWQSPPKVGAALLPIVEEIDPALVEECMWRAISFRHYRPVHDFVLGQEPEADDSRLAVFLARYDRALGTTIFPPEDFISAPLTNNTWSTQEIFVFTDPARIPSVTGKNSLNHFYFVQKAVETLLLEPSRRWDELTIPYK